jgi:FtsZ-binding cell division protein ZapB
MQVIPFAGHIYASTHLSDKRGLSGHLPINSTFPLPAFIRLARSNKLRYADSVASGGSPPHPLSVVQLAIQIPVNEGRRMTRKNTWVRFAVAVVLSLPLTACKDTKTLQENEQLKAHAAELQKENGQLQNDLEAMTADRDELKKENDKLQAQLKAPKTKKKAASRKHRHS